MFQIVMSSLCVCVLGPEWSEMEDQSSGAVATCNRAGRAGDLRQSPQERACPTGVRVPTVWVGMAGTQTYSGFLRRRFLSNLCIFGDSL